MHGVQTCEGLFTIGTTNFPDQIDPALMNRAGRFDRAYEIKKPNEKLRREYLIRKKTNQFLTEEQLNQLVQLTHDFSMATLNEIHVSLALQYHYDGEIDIAKIIDDLRQISNMQRKGNFSTEETTQPVGFVPMTENYKESSTKW